MSDTKYEYKTVQAMRGMEKRFIAREQTEGWELVDQTQGTLRTSLKFRRVQPEAFLSKAWVTFRALSTAKQGIVAAGMALLLVFAVVGIGIASGQEKRAESAAGNDEPAPSAAITASGETGPAQRTAPAAARESRSPAPTSSAEPEQVLTVENSAEFVTLLAVTDYCDPSIAEFAAKYEGRKIEFDGSITNMKNHEGYNTRYDILLGPGDDGPATTRGPAFKYEDVNMFDLKFTGATAPSYVGEGDTFRFTGEVDEYDPVRGCQFFLNPVSTTAR